MATFTITGRMSAKTVKKSFKVSSNSLSSPKILAISNIIRIFAIAFKRKKAVSKKSITILSCYRNTPNFKKEDGAFMLSLDVYAIGSRLVHILRREICSINPVPSKVIGVTSITTDMST